MKFQERGAWKFQGHSLDGSSYTSSGSSGAADVSAGLLLPLRRFLLRAHAGGFPSSRGAVVAARYGGVPPMDKGRAAARRRKARPLAADLAERHRLRAIRRAAMRERRDNAAGRGPGPLGALFGRHPADALPRADCSEADLMAALPPAAGRRAQATPHQNTRTHTHTRTNTTNNADDGGRARPPIE